MNMKRLLKVFIMFAVVMIALVQVVNAYSFSAVMTPSSTSLTPGQDFTVTIKVTNLDVGTNGINTVSGFLKYDSKLFDAVTTSSVSGINDWTANYSSENGKITLSKGKFVKADEEIAQIMFKVKSADDLKALKEATKGSINFTSIVASNSQDDITASDVSTTVTITPAGAADTNTTANTAGNTAGNTASNGIIISPTNQSQGSTTANNATNNAVKNTTNNTANTTNATNNTSNYSSYSGTNTTNTADGDVPYTGIDDTISYILIAAVVVAFIFYIKFEKIDNEIR